MRNDSSVSACLRAVYFQRGLKLTMISAMDQLVFESRVFPEGTQTYAHLSESKEQFESRVFPEGTQTERPLTLRHIEFESRVFPEGTQT